MNALLKRLARDAGIDRRVSPHGLRHTYARDLERAGTTVTQISRLLGHTSVAVTDRYLRSLTNREAIEALAAVELPSLDRQEAVAG